MTRPVQESEAVILSGGGAYGAYEVGVLHALLTGESPSTAHKLLNPGIYTGTSVGAFNAAFMCSRPETDVCTLVRCLTDVWLNRIAEAEGGCGNGVFRFRSDPRSFLNPNCLIGDPARPFANAFEDGAFFAQDWFRRGINFFASSTDLLKRSLELVDLSTLISSTPIQKLIGDSISLDGIRRSRAKLRVIATEWDTGGVAVFSNQDMTDEHGHLMIQASAAIPGVFPPVTIAGHIYVDGGLVMNTPLKCAITAGGTTLHVVYMDPNVQNIPLSKLRSTIDTLDRVFVISLARRIDEDIETAAWINEGLSVMERAAAGRLADGEEMRKFIRVAGQIEERIKEGAPYRKLTIHRYHPKDDLGGTLGLLNFDSRRLLALIERGFTDALNHDCDESHCVIPD